MNDQLRRAQLGNAATIQRKGDGAGGVPGKRTLTEALPGGAPSGGLPAPLRAKMESYFKTDFSAVRVREDDRARALGAIAYTQGNELVFQPGKYDPASRAGQELIGHELAHVVQQRQGRAAAPASGGGAPVQRYRDQQIDNIPFHVSDGGSMRVRSAGEDPNKTFFAKFDALQRAQAKLASTGSLFHLQATEVRDGFAKIEPRFMGRGSAEGNVYGATQDKTNAALTTHGPQTGMAADCNNAARMVMGIVHPPAQTDTAPATAAIERPVLSQGGGTHVLDGTAPVAGAKGMHERATLTALTTSLRDYRAVAATRPANAAHGASVAQFMELTAALAGSATATQAAWTIVGTLRRDHGAVYADFAAWAGLDAAIAPEVGDALVSWRLENDRKALNRRAYDAMITVFQNNIENEGQRGAMITQLGERIASQTAARTLLVEQIAADQAILDEQLSEGGDAGKLGNRKAAATNRLPERQRKRVSITDDLGRLTGVRGQLEGYQEGTGAALAAAALAMVGIAADTPWSTTRDTLNKNHAANNDEDIQTISGLCFGDTVDGQLTTALSNNDLWNKHWGGVVMTEPGGDYVTLENDASTDAQFGPVNAQWRFTMYGSKTAGQSFHAKMEASGDFGQRASTVRFRAPARTARDLPALTPAEQAEVARLEAEQAAIERAEAERVERERAERAEARQAAMARVQEQRAQELERLREIQLRLIKLGALSGFTTGSCRQEARGPSDRDDFGGGPPALFKAEPGAKAAINTDPALEAEADAHGAAAARHDEAP